MARIRTIKPEFWVDDQMVELDYMTRLLFIGLWNFVDDEGYIEYKPKRIKMQVFPADDLDVSRALQNLLEVQRLVVCDSDQGELLMVVNWHRHQRVSNATPTKFTSISPQTGGSGADSLENSVPVTKSSERSALKGKEGKGKEGKGKSSSSDAKASDRDSFSPDVLHLCDLLGELIKTNGNRLGTIGVTWWKAADRLIRIDGYTPAQVEFVLRWSQTDEFWQGVILSMPKLREKFDTLKTKAQADRKRQVRPAPIAKADQNAALFHELYGNGGNSERTRSLPALDPGIS